MSKNRSRHYVEAALLCNPSPIWLKRQAGARPTLVVTESDFGGGGGKGGPVVVIADSTRLEAAEAVEAEAASSSSSSGLGTTTALGVTSCNGQAPRISVSNVILK